MSTHVKAHAVWSDGRLRLTDAASYQRDLQRLKLADGEEVVIRVERPEDAIRLDQYKHLFGHVFTPVCEYAGYTKHELCLMAKAQFLPDGMTSLTEMNTEEMTAFVQAAEQWLREECGEAFEGHDVLHERRVMVER